MAAGLTAALDRRSVSFFKLTFGWGPSRGRFLVCSNQLRPSKTTYRPS